MKKTIIFSSIILLLGLCTVSFGADPCDCFTSPIPPMYILSQDNPNGTCYADQAGPDALCGQIMLCNLGSDNCYPKLCGGSPCYSGGAS